MRGYMEPVNLVTGQALTVGGKTILSDPFPMGEGWYLMMLRFGIVVTIGSGSGAITEGELSIIKNILFKTDRGENICNLPGRAAYKIGIFKAGSAPRKDAIAAASATYYVNLPLYFADFRMDRPEDTILDTSRYSSCTLEVQMGTVADLFSTVGSSSITLTLDVEVFRIKGPVPVKAKPKAFISYDVRPPVDAASVTQVFMERAQDLAVKRIYVHSGTSGVAGVPWSGTNADSIQNVVQIKDQSGYIVKDRIHAMVQEQNKNDFSLETLVVGVEVHDFVRDGSHESALITAGKSLLQYSWTNQGSPSTVAPVTVTVEGIRKLK